MSRIINYEQPTASEVKAELIALGLILKVINRYLARISPAGRKYLLSRLTEVECKDVVNFLLLKR